MCSALFGLGCVKHSIVKSTVDNIAQKLLEKATWQSIKSWSSLEMSSAIVAANLLLQSEFFAQAPWLARIEEMRSTLSKEIQKQSKAVNRSTSEHYYAKAASALSNEVDLDGIVIEVNSLNSWLHGFEADIVLKVSGRYRGHSISTFLVNVEIDGPSHRRATKARVCRIRDECMRRQGVIVGRWDLVDDLKGTVSKSILRKKFQTWLVCLIKEGVDISNRS